MRGAGLFIFALFGVFCVAGGAGGYIDLIEIEVYVPEELKGDVLVVERWHYHFSQPSSSVSRLLPVGFSGVKGCNCDAIGNILVFDGPELSSPLPEAPFGEEPAEGTFQVIEEVRLV